MEGGFVTGAQAVVDGTGALWVAGWKSASIVDPGAENPRKVAEVPYVIAVAPAHEGVWLLTEAGIAHLDAAGVYSPAEVACAPFLLHNSPGSGVRGPGGTVIWIVRASGLSRPVDGGDNYSAGTWLCGYADNTNSKGEVKFYVGTATSPSATISGVYNYDYLGTGVASGGDVDGDGLDDFVMSAPGAGTVGEAYVFYYPMATGTSGTADVTITGLDGADAVGLADADLDGYADVYVGAPGVDTAGTNAGAVYVFTAMAVSLSGTAAEAVIYGDAAYDNFGGYSLTLGDLDGDGASDLFVGAPYSSVAASYAGAGWIEYAPQSGSYSLASGDYDVQLLGQAASDFFGEDASLRGDFDGDGCAELAVSASGYGDGTVYVFDGC